MKAFLLTLCLSLAFNLSQGSAVAQSAETVMKPYLDVKGTSNVSGYGIGRSWIIVQFKDGSMYLYTGRSCGAETVREMKRLASLGEGLNSFINKNVKESYAEKLK